MLKLKKYHTLFAVILLVVLWGVTWSTIKVGLRDMPPMLFAGFRTLIGGLVLVLVALRHVDRFQWKSSWRVYIISCLLNVVLFFGLQTMGLYYLPSGLLSVLVYFEPILVGLLASWWLGERLTAFKLTGLVLGFLGIAAVSLHSLDGATSTIGIVLGLAAAISWAVGTVYLKRVQGQSDVLWTVAVQFTLGGILLLLVGFTREPIDAIHVNTTLLLSLLYSAVGGVSLSWFLWLRLVQAGAVSTVSAYVFFVPLLSVAIGIVFLHEAMSGWLFAGLALVVASIYLVNRGASGKPSRTVASER